ncbi:enoyl-CoA hydratase/isomerase family protein [Subtercola boreus]|uniref:Crotonase n=1 Tax=Subtercola boreus TaxID=120213 RepID=A0A3E0W7H1_9MICO|nr:enoyl-CoA hydratase/isomerase family protein [Subtercola boreus]RFA18825.1 crotonase [Subtercola boreus]RFA18939.1 crotonase [Subtercola boreus]RFA25477.1 crotonase [Subtercola boreus]
MTPSTREGRISVSSEGGVAAVVIDDPAHRNALTRTMCLQLQELMPQLDADPSVSVVTLRGAGETFSAGASIRDLPSVLMDAQADGTRIDQLSRADAAIAAVAKPTIALVDGACMGGGWQLASACDFIIASERSVFAITPAKLGVIYPRAGIERLVRLIGPATAKLILFAAEPFGATRAAQLGLVAEVVADSAFDQRVTSLVDVIQSRSQFSTHTLKRLVDGAGDRGPHVDLEWDAAWAAMAEGPDMAVGVAAFLARESPHFMWQPTGQGAVRIV